MLKGLVPLTMAGFAALMLAGAACGGGASTEEEGDRVTDPAAVPTSTPIGLGNPVLYQIRGDTISTTGGQATVTAGNTPTPAGGTAQTYTIAEGDFCSTIAAEFGVTVEAIVAANRNVNADCTNLHVGDVIRIPKPPVTPTPNAASTPRPGSPNATATATADSGGTTHTVASGETCGDIASQYGVDIGELIALNGLDADCTGLNIDQVLQIP